MKLVSIDVETNGPISGYHSLIELGAVIVEPELKQQFHIYVRPLFPNYDPSTMKASGLTRGSILARPTQDNIQIAMLKFYDWLALHKKENEALVFIGDNPGFDFSFVSHGFYVSGKHNPFGHSSMHIGSLFKGMNFDIKANFKKLRKTKHSHNALDDAMGNAEALLAFGPQIKGLL